MKNGEVELGVPGMNARNLVFGAIVKMYGKRPGLTDYMGAGCDQSLVGNDESTSGASFSSGSSAMANDHCGATRQFRQFLHGPRRIVRRWCEFLFRRWIAVRSIPVLSGHRGEAQSQGDQGNSETGHA